MLKRKRDDEEKDLGPREGESGEDYKARIMKTMDEAMESCSAALRIRNERVAEKIKAEAVAWDSVHVDDKGRVAVGEDVSLPAREIGSTRPGSVARFLLSRRAPSTRARSCTSRARPSSS